VREQNNINKTKGKKMKSALFNYVRTICLAGLLAAPLTLVAIPLQIGDAHYLGEITQNPVSSPETEVSFINSLAKLPVGGIGLVSDNGNMALANRLLSQLGEPFPLAVVDNAARQAGNGNADVTVDTTGFSYILAQLTLGRNAKTYVWLLPDNTQSVTLSVQEARGAQIMHVSLFNSAGGDNVPDGGTTLLLLGSVLAGLAAFRRKLA
jgi:hypothetical protein